MNANAMQGYVMAFRGDETQREGDAMVELVDVHSDGVIELGFDNGKERVYVQVNVGDLMRRVATFWKED